MGMGEVFVSKGFEISLGQKDGHADIVIVEEVIEGGEPFIARL